MDGKIELKDPLGAVEHSRKKKAKKKHRLSICRLGQNLPFIGTIYSRVKGGGRGTERARAGNRHDSEFFTMTDARMETSLPTQGNGGHALFFVNSLFFFTLPLLLHQEEVILGIFSRSNREAPSRVTCPFIHVAPPYNSLYSLLSIFKHIFVKVFIIYCEHF